jgi:hypothetical protein
LVPSHEPTRTQGRLIGDNSHLHLLTQFDQTVPRRAYAPQTATQFVQSKTQQTPSPETAAAVAIPRVIQKMTLLLSDERKPARLVLKKLAGF